MANEVQRFSGCGLAGRDAELGVLAHLVGELRAGRSALVTVTGPPGAGRSALLTAVVEQARAAGVRTAVARSSPIETELPYSTVAQLAGVLLPPEQLARISWMGAGETCEPKMCGRFLALAREEPLLVAVDDDQWTDPWSRRWWREVAQHSDGSAVLMVRAVRGGSAEVPDRFDGAIPVPVREIHLGPLSADDVEGMLPERGPREFAVAAAESTAGNPAVLSAALREYRAEGLSPHPRNLARFRQLAAEAEGELAERTVRGLPAEQARLLQAIAVCAGRFDFELVGAIAGMQPGAAAAAGDALAGHGLLEPGAATASAVLAEMDPARREQLHARAAEVGNRAAAVEPDVLAELLVHAPPLHSRWVVDTLVQSAARHRMAGRDERAAVLLRRALREPVADSYRAQLRTVLAASQVMHDPAAGDGGLRQVLADAPETADPAVLVRAADLLLARGDAELAWRELSRVCGQISEPALQALALLAADGCGPEPASAAPEVPALPEEPGDAAQAGVLAWRLACAGRHPDLVRTLARAALADRRSPLTPRIAAARALACRADLAEAAAGLTDVLSDARREGCLAAAANALVQRAIVATADERWTDAQADLAAAAEELPLHARHPMSQPHQVAAEITLALRRGNFDAAERAAAVELPLGAERGMAFSYLLHARGELRLAAGDAATALGYFQECGRIMRAKSRLNPAVLPWRRSAAAAQGVLGRTGAAAALGVEEREIAENWTAPGLLPHEHAPAAATTSGPSRVPETATPTALTTAERRTAALAVRGLSNGDIAAELGVTVRAVELRLTKVYRKLGVQRRAQLPAELDGRS
ncbi:AAA family ATPase [Saccharopolyspora sp. HNM0986]|uniref:AAA family ATPase n=2 Tax=Saccharopolyspora TaxID=1835 RepID=UPI00190981C5|nr:LuxR family transcriptional regulator [Saccharopolyspora sp. HNM0986]MBK0869230.1 AAA family ATPase [Saccharopolyspora sp. HNM0986]